MLKKSLPIFENDEIGKNVLSRCKRSFINIVVYIVKKEENRLRPFGHVSAGRFKPSIRNVSATLAWAQCSRILFDFSCNP